MPAFTLAQLKKYTDCKILQQTCTEFTDISTDTRSITPGMLFLALKGENFDGHDFLAQACEKGAIGLIISDKTKLPANVTKKSTILLVNNTLDAYLDIAGGWRDQFSLPVIAITGSNGKTTTKDLTAAVLSEKYSVLKTFKNFNSEVGIALTLLSITPSYDMAVVEMGMRGLGQIRRLAKTAKPDIGIILNVGNTHLELLGSQENIARAKGELVEAIKPQGTVILNVDNTYTAAMTSMTTAHIITFGIKNSADIMAENITVHSNNKTTFTCKLLNENLQLTIPLIGEHNVYDSLAAIAAGCAMGMTPLEIKAGLQKFRPSGMRFEIIAMHGYTVVNDAYNASPASMAAALDSLMSMTAQRHIVVFGDMKELGEIERTAHEQIGLLCVQKKVNILLTLGPLARYTAETAAHYGLKAVYNCSSHADAATKLKAILTAGDVVLFKGSHSMQMEKIINLLET
ncbi:UDP-N-acetylmuramoyl-tripeptide--D-alanyl-D-alanine ligase [Pectinatus frisingensis]|uniref:UDP-N-acetylmuramoyl-tripeptide--D-alanyl-D- alanine ligase n=1 Tax=Pectinatus frisingensis TaxID=865 RepID=UPI0018C58980|nr:UDP-N-acetylmuramoyl-tripeptide--D-alanyl-D-alanine ligase [Pectinatus frisingensis]